MATISFRPSRRRYDARVPPESLFADGLPAPPCGPNSPTPQAIHCPRSVCSSVSSPFCPKPLAKPDSSSWACFWPCCPLSSGLHLSSSPVARRRAEWGSVEFKTESVRVHSDGSCCALPARIIWGKDFSPVRSSSAGSHCGDAMNEHIQEVVPGGKGARSPVLGNACIHSRGDE
jgi:hypothetical protein